MGTKFNGTPTNLNINLENCEEMKCTNPECDSDLFAQIAKVRIIPALMSPTGRRGIAEIAIGFCCIKCGTVIKAKQIIDPQPEPAKPRLVEGGKPNES